MEENKVTFAFCRMNPPHIGHKLVTNVLSMCHNSRLYLTQTQGKKDPLTYDEKHMFAKEILGFDQIYPGTTIMNVLVELYNEGFKEIILVAGQDRLDTFKELINKYNGVEAKHGFYEFETIETISSGDRDPDSDDVTGISSSKMREFVANDDFEGFKTGMPEDYDPTGLFELLKEK